MRNSSVFRRARVAYEVSACRHAKRGKDCVAPFGLTVGSAGTGACCDGIASSGTSADDRGARSGCV
jgi:hypothetical protein